MPRKTKKVMTSKKMKDANCPKRPLSNYMHYAASVRAEIKAANPNATVGDIGKIMGQKWKDLTDEAKKPFTDLATAAKAKYEKLKAAYDATPGAIAFKAKKAALKKKEKEAAAAAEAKRAENESEEDEDATESEDEE